VQDSENNIILKRQGKKRTRDPTGRGQTRQQRNSAKDKKKKKKKKKLVKTLAESTLLTALLWQQE
jgi:hypothetical protein